jgi:hypothetical protein
VATRSFTEADQKFAAAAGESNRGEKCSAFDLEPLIAATSVLPETLWCARRCAPLPTLRLLRRRNCVKIITVPQFDIIQEFRSWLQSLASMAPLVVGPSSS